MNRSLSKETRKVLLFTPVMASKQGLLGCHVFARSAIIQSMDYDLARLGSHEFEHLVQALCFAAFGARVETFGDRA